MSDTVIKVENLSKQYRLGSVGTGTISHDLNRFWHRIRGNEDPYLKIGEENDRSAKGNSEYVWALQDINFEVKQGEVLGIIGRNGAGKSTLLKILSRTTSPTTGSVKIKGRVASLLEVGTGFHPELSGRENIFLNGAILGMTKQEIKNKFDEIVDFAGVEKYIDTPVKRYSSGMYVRLAFGVAAHLEPEILIIDEVLAVGDAEFQKKALGKMKDVSTKEGRTVLFVSHNMGMINQLCNYAILMKNGRLIACGETKRISELYLSHTVDESVNLPERHLDIDPTRNFQMTSIRLKNKKGEVTNQFECDDEFIVEIECIVRKPVNGLYGYFRISTRDQITILVSDTFDVGENKFEQLEIGKYSVKIKVPSRTIGQGEYSLYVSFSKKQGQHLKNIVDEPADDLLVITINDYSTQRGNSRQGYFSTLLNWDIQEVD